MYNHSIELIDGDDYAEVAVEFEAEVEPTEYEGSYLFYQGGASCSKVTVQPFEFKGVTYKTISPELFPFIDFNSRFLKVRPNKDVASFEDYIQDYIEWLFEEYVAPDVHVPVHRYPDSVTG